MAHTPTGGLHLYFMPPRVRAIGAAGDDSGSTHFINDEPAR
jgi:hypothetical protein